MALGKTCIRRLTLGILAGGVLFLLYPQEVVLVPETRLTVVYEGGEVVTHGEVSRNWNHYLGDGWKATVVRTDENGKVRFKVVTKRVPILIQFVKTVIAPFGHYYPGLGGSLIARDSNNHFIWKREDFRQSNCCPETIVIGLHEEEGEASDSYFTFGDVVPNE
ncbi:MAG: hypothetical protein ABIU09_06095 [Pyrinomonadaceae bacterium]